MKRMRRMKRFMAALLAVAILTAFMPAMKTEAAAQNIKARFVDWGRKTIQIDGDDYTTYDASESFIGLDKCNADYIYYEVFNLSKTQMYKSGTVRQSPDPNNRFPSYQVFKIKGARRTAVCLARVKARINNKWSNYSGWILLVPPHTPDYIRHAIWSKDGSINISWDKFQGIKDYYVYLSMDGVSWTRVKRTVGNKCSITSFKGKPLRSGKTYYYRVEGRALYNGKYYLEKGNSTVNYKRVYYIVVE